MTDLLVKLYELPPLEPPPRGADWRVRKVLAPEISTVAEWVGEKFSRTWAGEFRKAASGWPVTAFVAVAGNEPVGFACYDAAALGVFGPTGVADERRGAGLGRALLLACLHDMAAQGYAYAVIGGSGPDAFYEQTVGAVKIPGSEPGFYAGMIRPRP
ncbi:MAG: GNAT family N-acetyltransferase [Alphaproteobacteria bacterium]